ncbi:MAG TPA: DUF2203 domain-containing protein [Planctomycetaceae bacterium]|nr:DUF2203 domain-containing protein [Planctomycetaceae bacterium]
MNSTAPLQYFTLEEANKRLPLIRMIVRDIVELHPSVEDRRARFERLTEGQDAQHLESIYGQELQQSVERFQQDSERLDGYLAELAKLNVELKDPAAGLVHFRTQIGNRDVYYCWKLGEPEISCWHELDEGFESRQSLFEATAMRDGTENDQTENP